MYSFKYNQQDAALYSILYYCQCSTCFGRFFRPSSGAQKLYTRHRVCAKLACWNPLTLAVAASKLGKYPMPCVQFLSSWLWAEKPPETCRACELELTHASGSRKQAGHTPDAVCTVFEPLMMGGKTARNM